MATTVGVITQGPVIIAAVSRYAVCLSVAISCGPASSAISTARAHGGISQNMGLAKRGIWSALLAALTKSTRLPFALIPREKVHSSFALSLKILCLEGPVWLSIFCAPRTAHLPATTSRAEISSVIRNCAENGPVTGKDMHRGGPCSSIGREAIWKKVELPRGRCPS